MKLNCYSYQLPFKRPLTTSNKVYRHRKGLIFHLRTADFECYAEAAPLPGFSPETLDKIQQFAKKYSEEWGSLLTTEDAMQQLQAHYQADRVPSSLQFALDALTYQLQAHNAGLPLQTFLSKKSSPAIAVNGLLSVSHEDPLQVVRELQTRGFKTIKCKIGRNFDQEYHTLTQIREQFPELRIRLDANQAWPVDKAVANLSALKSLEIEYCEEPLRDPTPENYRKLSQQINLPLALDESINRNENWKSLVAYCRTLVIKPMVIGGFSRLFAIRREAQNAGCNLVFTSSLGSGIGRTITAALAGGLGSPHLAHGLNTGELLAQDILPGRPEITNGCIHLNTGLELIDPDLVHLKDISTKLF